MMYAQSRVMILALCAIVFWTAPVQAQSDDGPRVDIECDRDVIVGIPFELRIKVTNGELDRTPIVPAVDGLNIKYLGVQNTAGMTFIINGRQISKTPVTATFQIIADREGTFHIPGVSAFVSGEQYDAGAFDITATSVAIPEVFDAVLEAADSEVYLGEPIDLTLRVYIRPFSDARREITMSANDMFGQVLAQASNWGVFRDDLFEKRQLQSREVERRMEDGTIVTMYEYLLRARVWPTDTGEFQPGRVAVVMRYPRQLQERILSRSSKSFFVSSSAIVSAVPELPEITVKTLPEAGRPDSFNGAVGRFIIESEAQPLNVAVGDPITLRVTLIDQSARGTRLDGVQVPPLHQQTTLVDDFRVPEEQLPGEQIGRRKSFVQTIRPRHADIDRIPPISLSYFNAETGRYETTFSDPIPITVRESASVGMNEIVAAQAGEAATSMEMTKVAGGLVANYTGDEVLTVDARETSTLASAAVVVVPPALCAAALLVRRRRERLRTDHTFARRKQAKSRASGHLQAIGESSSTPDAAEAVLHAVTGFLADRLGRSADAMTSRETRAELESIGIDETLRLRVDTLLRTCEAARYAGASGEAPRLRDEAHAVIDELERSGRLS
jgi:hypothetical protein